MNEYQGAERSSNPPLSLVPCILHLSESFEKIHGSDSIERSSNPLSRVESVLAREFDSS